MSGQTWLVTGATGFLGRHVLDCLSRDSSIRVVVAVRTAPAIPVKAENCLTIPDDSPESWESVIERARPNVILNIAGRTPPADASAMVRDNVELVRTLIRTLERLGAPVRFVQCGSAAELGNVPVERLPADESIVPAPETEYGRSKWAATRIVLAANSPVEPIIGRLFNVIGPGQPSGQVFGRYAREFGSTRRGSEKFWIVPGIASKRDFIDVRDCASALIALAHEGQSGRMYHIGRGGSRSVGDGLELLARLCGIDARFSDDSNGVPSGPVDSVADIRRIVSETSWRPTVSFEQSIEDLWREMTDIG
jgi:GDP-4-dehydro-6-deoxy-D-mannose reductase